MTGIESLGEKVGCGAATDDNSVGLLSFDRGGEFAYVMLEVGCDG